MAPGMQLPGALRPGGHRGNHPHLAALGAGVGHMLSTVVHPERPKERRSPHRPVGVAVRDYPLELGDEYYVELGCLPPHDHPTS